MVSAEDAIRILKLISTNSIPVWLTGGWGIDALLGRQTRPHKDLDLVMLLDDVLPLRQLLAGKGYALKDLWSENSFTRDGSGNETATAFVLQDAEGHEIDLHALRMDDNGNGIPAWDEKEDFIFTRADLSGRGMILTLPVCCVTPESQVFCHLGYELPDTQVKDLHNLRQAFDVNLPPICG